MTDRELNQSLGECPHSPTSKVEVTAPFGTVPRNGVSSPSNDVHTADRYRPAVASDELVYPDPVRLRCPKCGSLLDIPQTRDASGRSRWVDYCVIDCCTPWCVVGGIPLFSYRPRLVRLIRAGKNRQALLLALRPQWHSSSGLAAKFRVQKILKELDGQISDLRHRILLARKPTFKTWIDDCFRADHQDVRDYYFYKFTTPKHLIALATASTLPPGRILDVGCGTGQITRALAARGPVVGIDREFRLLFLARSYIAPEADFVCCDAEQPLPFAEESFRSTISSNAFHFIRTQEALLHNLRRVTSGPIALTSLRHSDFRNQVPNHARSINGYRELATKAGMRARIVSDQAILARYLQGVGPDFTADHGADPSTPLITAMLDGTEIRYGNLPNWPHAGRAKNPLYVERVGGFEIRWPSAGFKADNPGIECLPERISNDHDRHFALIDKPDNYD